MRGPILFFDGVCNTCNAAVDFILRHDHAGQFLFCPLQSARAHELLAPYGASPDALETLVLLDGDRVLTRSSAVLEIARRLGFPWTIFRVFSILPRAFTDWLYRGFAKRRYQLFGKRDHCRLPTPAEAQRFL